MARLPYLDAESLGAEDRDLLERPINLRRQLVHSPRLARAFGGLNRYFRHESPLNPRLRELAILQVGWTARAPYEWSHHVKISSDFGVTEDDVRAICAGGAGLGELEQAVLDAARHLTVEASLTDTQFAALRAKLDETELVDLLAVIGFYACVIRVLASLQVDVEPEYQQYLDRFPLPRS
ncbi:MAG TPA: carboxymuconolactone decarboxylase family protein [Burkholderiaceae bacterium]|nr:carboxymuconolactone decarboxylase family protein [Burkholderiaceae bacterium]